MGDVVRLAQFQNRDTVALLRALTIAAVNGDVIGIKVEIRMRNGRAVNCDSGHYVQQRSADGTSDSGE